MHNHRPRDLSSRSQPPGARTARLRIAIRGAVQGVGFRPFVYRLATEMGLSGWVANDSSGVHIEVEGPAGELERFLLRIEPEKPPRAIIQGLEPAFLDPAGYARFEIRESLETALKTAVILPDIAVCDSCLAEIFDPSDRRHLYPFTTCTQCGPRFTIIEALPYDRPNTTMRRFTMCPRCRAEYDDPLDRRFHAQPNACPECGPALAYADSGGTVGAAGHDALRAAAQAVRGGRIVAVKGLGGFHLIVDAQSEAAVARLRARKHREEKPFAVMYPSLDMIEADCLLSPPERRLLVSPESPIVLLKRRNPWNDERSRIARNVAPENTRLGIMRAYTPLHYILMAELGIPVVATSGNRSDEPICTDEHDAMERLGGIADFFLVHNRPIARHVDDSIVRISAGRELVLRRARGYAPLPIRLEGAAPALAAAGGHLKNTVAVSVETNVFVSQHIGDLETPEAYDAFKNAIGDLERLYDCRPEAVACDMHPDYLSTQWAREGAVPAIPVQHHYAHVLSCMAENEIGGDVLGVAWDGTGYGPDGTVWGGEFLKVTDAGFERVGHFRTFPLPGGEAAVKEPRRSALGALYACFGSAAFSMQELPPVRAFSPHDLHILQAMLEKSLNSPLTSSAGRLFDAVASLLDLHQTMRFEGQAAMALEFAAEGAATDDCYEIAFSGGQEEAGSRACFVFDWEPMLHKILDDRRNGLPAGVISARFHNTLAESIVAMARRTCETRIVLTGGCFQNAYLGERAVSRLRGEGFRPYWHQRVPPNDGGISLGQIAALARIMKR
ncbi:MAG: carbamoyltransferase HypF [Chitinivibrionia bacterium]|nr:carbamoyltransferase HypF [Chitinivibrionia bacterium]